MLLLLPAVCPALPPPFSSAGLLPVYCTACTALLSSFYLACLSSAPRLAFHCITLDKLRCGSDGFRHTWTHTCLAAAPTSCAVLWGFSCMSYPAFPFLLLVPCSDPGMTKCWKLPRRRQYLPCGCASQQQSDCLRNPNMTSLFYMHWFCVHIHPLQRLRPSTLDLPTPLYVAARLQRRPFCGPERGELAGGQPGGAGEGFRGLREGC